MLKDYFDIVIAPNDAPVVANPLADRSFAVDSPVAFTLPADAFSDADGDTLTYTTTLADDSALPTWLSFDANSRSFSGTPPLNYNGTLSVKVTASDGILSTSDTFNLAIASANDAPVVANPLADQSFAEDSPVAFTLPANSFSDADGDVLTYTATLADGTALPAWLSFDAASRSFSGTPPLNYTGTLSVKVTASDGAATTSDTFNLAIAGANDAPVVATPLADQSFAEDSPVAFTLPANSFSDADGDTLTYTATLADGTALPTWLSFNATSRSFSGTPPLNYNGTISVKVTASDGTASTSDTFNLAIASVNDAPVLATPLADQSFAEDSPVAFTLPANSFTDADGDTLTYTATLADGSALPTWLSFNAASRSFSGTPPLNFNGTLSVKVTASDGTATVSDTFNIVVSNTNDAPVVATPLADQSFAEDSSIAFTLPANSFSDADGDTLIYTATLADGTALPAWLSFDATSRSFSGTPPLNYTGTLSVKVTASDGILSTSDTFVLAIAGDNDAPVIANPLADQSFAEDSPVAFTLPANSFSDADGDALTYTADTRRRLRAAILAQLRRRQPQFQRHPAAQLHRHAVGQSHGVRRCRLKLRHVRHRRLQRQRRTRRGQHARRPVLRRGQLHCLHAAGQQLQRCRRRYADLHRDTGRWHGAARLAQLRRHQPQLFRHPAAELHRNAVGQGHCVRRHPLDIRHLRAVDRRRQ